MSKGNKYCRECGENLLSQKVPGHSVRIHMMDSGGGSWMRYESRFDPETGKVHMVEIRKCPNHKRGFFGDNAHDILMVDGDGENTENKKVSGTEVCTKCRETQPM